MRPVVKEYSKKFFPSQNESKIDDVTRRHQQLFWEIVMPITILDIKQLNVMHTKNITRNLSTRIEILVFFKDEENKILLHPY